MIEVQNSEETVSERKQMFGNTKVMSCIALGKKKYTFSAVYILPFN